MNTNVLETGNVKVSDFNPFVHQVNKSYSKRDNTSFKEIEPQTNKTWSDLIENINPNVNVYNYQLDEDLYIPVLLSKSNQNKETTEIKYTYNIESEVDNTHNKTKTTLQTEENTSTENIHLISGCFSEKQNAETFVKELKSKGYNAHIVDKNKGLYRVSAQSFSSKSEAKSFKHKLSNDGYSSWILKK
jgi:cell division protein FtsN